MDTTELEPVTGTAATAGPGRAASYALLGLVVVITAMGVLGDPHEHAAPDSPTTCCRVRNRATTLPVDLTLPVASSPDDRQGSTTSSPDRVADHLGGIAARLHTPDGAPIAGHVFLLMGAHGSTENARLYDQTPYTHDARAHPDTTASNLIAHEAVDALTEMEFDLVEFTNAPGGGPSGGITRAIAYLNIISNGAFTGHLRIAATGRLEPGGHLGSIDHIDAKTAAAHLADTDVLFTPTVPTAETSTRYGTRLIGEIARNPNTGSTLHDPTRLESFYEWGATRASGMDIVDARHLIDVASYLCGTGSTYACHITDLLDQQAQQRHDQLQDQTRSESERLRAASQQSSSSDTDAA